MPPPLPKQVSGAGFALRIEDVAGVVRLVRRARRCGRRNSRPSTAGRGVVFGADPRSVTALPCPERLEALWLAPLAMSDM